VLRHTLVGERELTKAKNGLEAAFVLGQDSAFNQGMVLGQYEVAGDWRQVDNYIPSIRAVRAEDLRRVVQEYLTAANRTAVTLEPLPAPAGRPLPPPAPPSGIVH
jgi:predicted Zn-dependent peptidase